MLSTTKLLLIKIRTPFSFVTGLSRFISSFLFYATVYLVVFRVYHLKLLFELNLRQFNEILVYPVSKTQPGNDMTSPNQECNGNFEYLGISGCYYSS